MKKISLIIIFAIFSTRIFSSLEDRYSKTMIKYQMILKNITSKDFRSRIPSLKKEMKNLLTDNELPDNKKELLEKSLVQLNLNDYLSNCIKEIEDYGSDESKMVANIGKMIESTMRKEISNTSCEFNPFDENTISIFLKDLEKKQSVDMIELTKKKAKKNAMKTYMYFTYSFTDRIKLNSNGSLSENSKVLILSDTCGKVEGRSNHCSIGEEKEVLSLAQEEVSELKKNKIPHNQSNEFVRLNLNQKIAKLNAYLAKEMTSGKKITTNNENYDQYFKEYLKTSSKEEGLLMLTETLNKKIGAIPEKKNLNDDSAKTYTVPAHQLVHSSDDVKLAIDEIITSISSNLKDIATYGSLERLLRVNPIAVGEALAQKPDRVVEVCQILKRILKDKESEKIKNDVMMWGGIAVGGALILTGVGSFAGGAIAGGAISAGVAAVSSSSLMSGLLLTGTVVGAVETAHYSELALQKKLESYEIRSGINSGNMDSSAVQVLDNTIKDFEEAYFNTKLSLILTAINVSSLKTVGQTAKNSSTLIKEMKAVKAVFDHPEFIKFKSIAAGLNQANKLKLAKLIDKIKSLPQKVQEYILTFFQNIKDKTILEKFLNDKKMMETINQCII